MKIALVHNFYQQPGGEEQVFAAEGALLEAHGHEVARYTVHNDEVKALGKMALAKSAIWNTEHYRKTRAFFHQAKPDVVHVHNTLPLISPAVYYAAHAEGAAVVQTLHNFRYSCVNGLFFREGRVCEDCLGKTVPLPGVRHACYRQSRAASAAVASMLGYHKLRGTYQNEVDQYIALTEFSRAKFVEMGLPADKLSVKPNFVAPDAGPGSGQGGYALFAGRLSAEKGIATLLEAWQALGHRIPLKIVGDGPLGDSVRAASAIPGIEWLGRKSREVVLELMGEAKMLVFPSGWYEGFPMTIVEALTMGTPIIASAVGNMASLIEHKRTGLHFEPGNASDLARQVLWALDSPRAWAQMRLEARLEFENKYTASVNHERLMDIYSRAVSRFKAR